MKFDGYHRTAYIEEADALAVADVHIGMEASAWSGGHSPRLGEYEHLAGDLEEAIGRFSPSRLVLCGDVLHEFGGTTRATREDLEGIITTADGMEITVVEGSHDRQLRHLLPESIEPPTQYAEINGVVFAHGDSTVPGKVVKRAASMVVGHVHPVLEIQGKRHPCYLYGRRAFHGTNLLVLPAFNHLCSGVAVNRIDDLVLPAAPGIRLRHMDVALDGDDGLIRFPGLGKITSMVE